MGTALPTYVMLAVGIPTALASQITLQNPSAAPGASVLVPVTFAAQSTSVSGLQFDVQFDDSAMSLAATIGDPARNTGKNLYIADLAPNKKRVLIIGLNQNSIQDGTIINLFVNVSTNAPSGVYALTLSGVCGTDPSGQSALVSGSDGSITVQETGSQGAPLQANGVLSAASLLPVPVAPGELITLMGSGIGPASPQAAVGSASNTTLGGTSVFFDGIPAPLLYAAANQINAVVPFTLTGKTSTQLEIAAQGRQMAGLALPVTAAAPAIFTLNSAGIGPGAILNQDASLNSPSNPADKGSIVALFATGAGQTNPPGQDGQITGATLAKPLLPVSVQIGGVDATVLYAGAAPGLIAGALQVNAVIPAAAPSGPAVPVVLTIGVANSQTGVTLAIK